MEKKDLELIASALELISQTANEAWWKGCGEHCGANFNAVTCEPCFAFEQCKRNEKLIPIFEKLSKI